MIFLIHLFVGWGMMIYALPVLTQFLFLLVQSTLCVIALMLGVTGRAHGHGWWDYRINCKMWSLYACIQRTNWLVIIFSLEAVLTCICAYVLLPFFWMGSKFLLDCQILKISWQWKEMLYIFKTQLKCYSDSVNI